MSQSRLNASPETSVANSDEVKQIDFVKHVQPILRARYYDCHGADAPEAGLRLDIRKADFSGGDNGKVIVAGKSGESLLMLSVLGEDEDTRMPTVSVAREVI